MNTLVKRIIFDSKQTFIIFGIAFALIFILYLGVNIIEFKLLDAFMIATYVSIGVAFISSLFRYSFLLSQRRTIFEYQGLANKKYYHLVVILSEVFAYLLIDLLILAIFYGFNIEALIDKEQYQSFYLLDNIYNLLFLKYLITIAIYTLFNISYTIKAYVVSFAAAILCAIYLFQLATTHILFNVLFIIILLILNVYIYQVKMKRHDQSQLALISFSFIMVFVMLFIKDFVLVPSVSNSSYRFIDFGKYSINILPIITILIAIILMSKQLYRKFFSPKVFIIALVIPLFIASGATQIININNNKMYQNYDMESIKNAILIQHGYSEVNPINASINLTKLTKEQRGQLFEKLNDSFIYNYQSEFYDVDEQYLIANDLIFISYYHDNLVNTMVLKQAKFDEIMSDFGFKKVDFYMGYSYNNAEIKKIIINDKLIAYEEIIKGSLKEYFDMTRVKFHVDNALFKQLSQLRKQTISYSEELYEANNTLWYRISLYIYDGESVGSDFQYLKSSEAVAKEGGE